MTLSDPRHEAVDKYCDGGFCPIELGHRIANRFIVLHKLGYGGFATVWLVRDGEARHGRYVALKVFAARWSQTCKPAAVVDRLRRFERDNQFPGLFITELERCFHTSRNGRHLCQIFPVLGPSLATLSNEPLLLYPSFVKDFARQLARALHTLHGLGICHGDFTLNNLVLGLTASFDRLTEAELDEILGAPVTESLEFASSENPSPAPPYAVHSVNLALLPAAYLSSKLCIIDFDQAFLITEPRRELSRIPTLYLAPESIFTLTNGPAADIWALGCLLFSLRTSWSLFQDLMTCTPRSTVLRMYQVLGSLPQQWKSFPFHLGYPVHEPLQPGVEYKTFEWLDDHSGGDLQELVEDILEPLRPQTTQGRDDGIGKFCLPVPSFSRSYTRARFEAEQLTPIKKEDALLFTDLLRQIFTYDHQKRITARQILEHHWLREPDVDQDGAGPATRAQSSDSQNDVGETKRSLSGKKTSEETMTVGISTPKGRGVSEPNQGEKKDQAKEPKKTVKG